MWAVNTHEYRCLMSLCFCMNFNCCLSLSHSLLLVQYCVSPHHFQYLKLHPVVMWHYSLFVFLFPSPIRWHLFFFWTTLSSTFVFIASHIIPIVHLCLSPSSQHCLYPIVSSLHLPKGPFFRFQTYIDWLKQPSPLTLPSWVPCLQRLKLVPVYGALFLAVNSIFPLSYVRTDEFLDENFLFRYCDKVEWKASLA